MSKIYRVAILSMFLIFIAFVVASAENLPDTGQTQCYNYSGDEIVCPQPGNFFYGQDATYTINPPSYIRLNSDHTEWTGADGDPDYWVMVQDKITGLTWEVKTIDGSIHDKNNEFSWQEAADIFIKDLNDNKFGGYADWRLPTLKELISIVNRDNFLPAINKDYFPNQIARGYKTNTWSSTTSDYNNDNIFCVDFNYGHFNPISKDSESYVRAVRGNTSLAQMEDNGDGTVTDTSTGLIWQKVPLEKKMNWTSALEYCENLTLADYNDWRMPNINELQSLVNYSKNGPAIDSLFDPLSDSLLEREIISGCYWSATTFKFFPAAPWLINFKNGNSTFIFKTNGNYVRAVRGGYPQTVIHGTLTINDTLLTSPGFASCKIVVARPDGTPFFPAAEDMNGLNDQDQYKIIIPLDIQDGASTGSMAVIHAYDENGMELEILEPENGQFDVGVDGGLTQINLVLASPPLINSYTVSSQTIFPGGTVNLSWDISGADSAQIDKTIGEITLPTGMVQLSPDVTTAYTLTVSNRYCVEPVSKTVTVNVVSPKITSFTATSSTFYSGEEVNLSWRINGANSASIDNGVGVISVTDGAYTVKPETTTTYMLTASNPIGTVKDSVTVKLKVLPDPPVINSFTAIPNTIYAGAKAELTWDIDAASWIQINQGIGYVTPASAGSIDVEPSQTTTYTLTATNDGGSDTKQVTVEVAAKPALPVINSFTATPNKIDAGDGAKLAWDISGATVVQINQGVGYVTHASAGSIEVNPSQTTTYTIIANNNAGLVTKQVTASVEEADTLPPVIIDFRATRERDRNNFELQDSWTLSWNVDNADSAYIDNNVGIVNFPSGTTHVYPETTTTYKLTAENSTDRVTASVTILIGDREVEILEGPAKGTLISISEGEFSDLPTSREAPAIEDSEESFLEFSYGVIDFSIQDLLPGSSLTVTFTMPRSIPENTDCYIYERIRNNFVYKNQYTLHDGDKILEMEDGDNTFSIIVTDGEFEDIDGSINGQIDFSGGLSSAEIFKLYYPRVLTTDGWETEICVINTSDNQELNGIFKAYDHNGETVSEIPDLSLQPRARQEIKVGNKFSNSHDISYIVFESSSDLSTGYTKIYQNGKYRVAVPAFSGYNTDDISIPHIVSNSKWWTGISLVNTTSLAKELTIEFSNGDQKQIGLGENEQKTFVISDIFDQESQPDIESAIIKNCDGVVGLELFGSADNGNKLSGILLKDAVAQKMYFPHVDQGAKWWTGIVLYNPSALDANATIMPYNEDGTSLSASRQNIVIAGHEKYVKNIKELELPDTTAWLKIEATNPITGFELFGTTDDKCLAGYTGVNISKRKGIFAKLEKEGWTGIAFVNTEDQSAIIDLTAYNDAGNIVATEEIELSDHAKRVDIAEKYFIQDISTATYIKYSSDKEIVGFQLNGSSDSMMLDGLPGM